MWEELSELRKTFLSKPELNTEIYKDFIIHRFLYETLKLTGNDLPRQEFEEMIHSGKRPHKTDMLKAYDLWQAWLYIAKAAGKQEEFNLEFTRSIAARVMKHTGKETTTTVGRYDTSLGDFRLGEDYNEIYPLADYRKIPELLDAACQNVNTHINKVNGIRTLRLAADFAYEYAHIRPFGAGNLATGLLLMNYILLYHNEPLVILFTDDRADLLNALKRGKINQYPQIFESFVAEQQMKFLKEQLGL